MPDESHTGPEPDETDAQAEVRRRREAYATLDDEDGDSSHEAPFPVIGLVDALTMLRSGDQWAIEQLRAVAGSEGWQRLDTIRRSVCVDWLRRKLRGTRDQCWQVAVGQILGTLTRAGDWRDAPAAAAVVDAADPDPHAWIKTHLQPAAAELVPTAPGLAYFRRAVLVHAARGQGKTTYAAFVVDQALRGGLRVLLLVDDDPESWAAQLAQRDSPLDGLIPLAMPSTAATGALEAAVETHKPDIIVVDSWRRWAFASGIRDAGALNDEAQCGPIADRLVDVARSGPGVVLLANEPKGGESSRGSVAPEDAVNGAVRRLTRETGSDVTTIETAGKVRHGVPAGPWHMTMTDTGFEPDPDNGQRATVEAHRDALDKMLPEIRALLEDSGEPMTVNQIMKALPGKGGRRVRDVIESAVNVAVHAESLRVVKVLRRGQTYDGFEVRNGTPPHASPTPPREASDDARKNASPPPRRGAGGVCVHEVESGERLPDESGEAFEAAAAPDPTCQNGETMTDKPITGDSAGDPLDHGDEDRIVPLSSMPVPDGLVTDFPPCMLWEWPDDAAPLVPLAVRVEVGDDPREWTRWPSLVLETAQGEAVVSLPIDTRMVALALLALPDAWETWCSSLPDDKGAFMRHVGLALMEHATTHPPMPDADGRLAFVFEAAA